jgi:hypothetical protein
VGRAPADPPPGHVSDYPTVIAPRSSISAENFACLSHPVGTAGLLRSLLLAFGSPPRPQPPSPGGGRAFAPAAGRTPPGRLLREVRACFQLMRGRKPRRDQPSRRGFRRSALMSIRKFMRGKTFDPERLVVLNAAFQDACADLGVTERTPHARRTVAKKVLDVADGQRRPEAIRAAVVASLKPSR